MEAILGLHSFHNLTRCQHRKKICGRLCSAESPFIFRRIGMTEEILKENGTDLLYSTAVKYGELRNVGYHIVLGRKQKAYHIQLRFPYDSFFHLIGLQHLKDLTYPSRNKERIYKEIRGKNITYEMVSQSHYFEEFHIRERIENLNSLGNMQNIPE